MPRHTDHAHCERSQGPHRTEAALRRPQHPSRLLRHYSKARALLAVRYRRAEAGDMEGRWMWLRVIRVIEE